MGCGRYGFLAVKKTLFFFIQLPYSTQIYPESTLYVYIYIYMCTNIQTYLIMQKYKGLRLVYEMTMKIIRMIIMRKGPIWIPGRLLYAFVTCYSTWPSSHDPAIWRLRSHFCLGILLYLATNRFLPTVPTFWDWSCTKSPWFDGLVVGGVANIRLK